MLLFIAPIVFGYKRTKGEGGRTSISGNVLGMDIYNKFQDPSGQYYSEKDERVTLLNIAIIK